SAHVSAADCHVLWAQKDNVLQPKADVTATEGEAVTLGCEYNTSSTTPYLYWYKQDVSDRPRFILSRSKFSLEKTEDGVKDRFKSRLNSTLRSLQPSDSALYYCAVKPTVTGNTQSLYKNLWRSLKTPMRAAMAFEGEEPSGNTRG
uniref:Ig-like domain-containing protein n=1 Tax=Myripristis murdjan TaxID=586833 RepID=A0A667WM47_9TELE